MSAKYINVGLEDGSLWVPADLSDALFEEFDALSGRLTVAKAQTLIERWQREAASR